MHKIRRPPGQNFFCSLSPSGRRRGRWEEHVFNLLKRGKNIQKTHFFYDTKLRQSWAKHQNRYSVCMGEKSGLRKLAA